MSTWWSIADVGFVTDKVSQSKTNKSITTAKLHLLARIIIYEFDFILDVEYVADDKVKPELDKAQ